MDTLPREITAPRRTPEETRPVVQNGERSAAVPGPGIFWMIFAALFVYALVRYVVFGDVESAQIPLFITNKALAFAAVVCLMMAGWRGVWHRHEASKQWGRWALHTAGIHSVISVALLTGDYYAGFFGELLLNARGEMSLLAAVLALYCFCTIGGLAEHSQRRRALLASAFVSAHVLFFGFPGWVDVEAWLGGLPPISLLGFAAALAAFGTYAVSLFWHRGAR